MLKTLLLVFLFCFLSAEAVTGPDVCGLPLVPGPCKAIIPRWGYAVKEHRCVQFNYGGCQGNGNNFATKNDCLKGCLIDYDE